MATPLKGIPPDLVGELDRIEPHIAAILANKPDLKRLYEATASHADKGEVVLQQIIFQSSAKATSANFIKNEVALIEGNIRNKSPSKRAPYRVVERFDAIRLKAMEIVELNQEAKRAVFPRMAQAVTFQNFDMLDNLCDVLFQQSKIEENLASLIQQEIEFLRRGE